MLTLQDGLSAFSGFLVLESFIGANPMAGVKMSKVPDLVVPTLSPKDVKLLLAQPDLKAPSVFAITPNFIDTTIRVGEQTNLKTAASTSNKTSSRCWAKATRSALCPSANGWPRQGINEVKAASSIPLNRDLLVLTHLLKLF